MKDEYYKEIGFMCGLEIHQRLATKEKLFCSCDATLAKDESVAEINRRQRAVAGELGRVDLASEFESSKNRRFVYNAFKREDCLVDIDEEPPHRLNKEALDIALRISAQFDSKVPDEFEPMRKGVVDGSDPSAFQRTLLTGYGGKVNCNGKDVTITSIFLEEESAGIDYSDSEMVVYNLDRIGVPLIEIDTDPVISTPAEARDVARRIGLLLRLTGKVQRGIGSIRQDVNVSIRGGARVEIKGFQELDTIPEIIDKEIERQQNLIKIIATLKEKKASVGEMADATHLFANTNVAIIRKGLEKGGAVYAFRLHGFKGVLGMEINPNRRLGSEISDYAKLAGVGGIIHSDEDMKHYGFSDKELAAVRELLKMAGDDAFVMVSGPKEVCRTAAGYARRRAEIAMREVPNETRGADSKMLVTKFMRPLPGGARMYPETDTRPIGLDAARYAELVKEKVDVERISAALMKEMNNRQLAEQMLWSQYMPLYKSVMKETGVDGSVVAPVLLERLKELRRSGIDVDAIGDDVIIGIFKRYAKGAITKAAIEELLKLVPADETQIDQLIAKHCLKRISGKEMQSLLKGMKGKAKGEILKEVMSKYRLNVDGTELSALIEERQQ